MLGAMMIALPNIVNAVDDGLGTNVMPNIRVQTDGVIDLSGTQITNWNQVGSTADVYNLQGATNVLNTRIEALDAAGTGTVAVLQDATNSINTSVTNIIYTQGLTNAGFDDRIYDNSTGKVDRAGDTMTGPLVVSNDLAVAGNVTYRPGAQLIADNSTTIQVAQAFTRIGTDGSLWDFSGCALQIAPGLPGQMLIIQAANSGITLSDGRGVKLAEGVSFTMSANDTLQLIYDGSNWIELHRSDND